MIFFYYVSIKAVKLKQSCASEILIDLRILKGEECSVSLAPMWYCAPDKFTKPQNNLHF